MSTRGNDPAHHIASDIIGHTGGLTIREHFAGMAMQGIIQRREVGLEERAWACAQAVKWSDALVKALAKEQK